MWQLTNSWDRHDSSVMRFTVGEPRWRRRARTAGVRFTTTRESRRRARHEAAGTTVGAEAAPAITAVLRRHGIDTPPQVQGDSVVWCSPQIGFPIPWRDPEYEPDPLDCVDIWLHIDQHRRTISVDVDARDLASFVTGTTQFDGPTRVPLDDRLDAAMPVVAAHLDRLCSAAVGGGV